MFKVECVTAQKPDAMTKAVNDTISTLTSSGYKIMILGTLLALLPIACTH